MKSGHHLSHDRASKGYGSIPCLTSQTSLHACLQRLIIRCKSVCEIKPGIDPCPSLAWSCDRWWPDFITFTTYKRLKGEFHGSAHARILTGLCTLSGTGPGFSLLMNQSWASYLILHANSPKIVNRRINLLGQQINSTVHCVGKICWNPLRILVIRLLPRLAIASDYWTTSQCGFEAITLIRS